MKLFSKEDLSKARSVDMYEFLRAHGKGELKGSGRYPKYHINGHESIVIDRRKNYFYHNGAHHGDDLLTFLKEYEGYSFPQAIAFLNGEEFDSHENYLEQYEDDGQFEYSYAPDSSNQQIKKYLIGERGIDREIVDYLIDNGYLIQEKKFKNAVFHWREFGLPRGDIVGAMAQGTVIDHERFGKRGTAKFIAKNSKKNYGFNVTLGQPESYYFFESSIDLLSYWSAHKDLYNCRLISLEGLKKQTIATFIQETYLQFDQLPKNGIFYGVDNDAAGHRLFDHANHYINIAKEKGGEAAPNTALIPFNNQIPKEYYSMYKEISEDYLNVTWDMLATVHKIETNLSNDNKIANDYELHSSLAVLPGPKVDIHEIDVRAALIEIAERIEREEITKETFHTLYPTEEKNLYTEYFVKDKLSETFAMYSEGQYEVVDSVGKDWNDSIKQQRSKGLHTEREPLEAANREADHVYGNMNEEFTYYLEDAMSKMKIKHQLVDTFGIHPSIVTTLVKKGLIRQDVNDRIVYLWNNAGTVVGGQIRGTFFDKKAFGRVGYEQKVMDLSREGYGFNVTLGKPDTICFFQNPEDLLSYWSLNVDQLKDTILFSLSDTKAEHVVEAINSKLELGHSINSVVMCIGNNQAGMTLLDDISQLQDFDLQTRSIQTAGKATIALSSFRPKIGVDWLAELHAKKERQARLQQYKRIQQKQTTQTQEQAYNYTRG